MLTHVLGKWTTMIGSSLEAFGDPDSSILYSPKLLNTKILKDFKG
jgi:hypothetical protein